MTTAIMPTGADLQKAHSIFRKHESRDLFYRAAIALVDLAEKDHAPLNLAEAIAVLLQTWNKAFYQYRGGFKQKDLAAIEQLTDRHTELLSSFRPREINNFDDTDETIVESLFREFEPVVGPVGTAKILHLLAPNFFPLWDRKIAGKYRCRITTGSNGAKYVRFMKQCQNQIKQLVNEGAKPNLKLLDEFNYVSFTKNWH